MGAVAVLIEDGHDEHFPDSEPGSGCQPRKLYLEREAQSHGFPVLLPVPIVKPVRLDPDRDLR